MRGDLGRLVAEGAGGAGKRSAWRHGCLGIWCWKDTGVTQGL